MREARTHIAGDSSSSVYPIFAIDVAVDLDATFTDRLCHGRDHWTWTLASLNDWTLADEDDLTFDLFKLPVSLLNMASTSRSKVIQAQHTTQTSKDKREQTHSDLIRSTGLNVQLTTNQHG